MATPTATRAPERTTTQLFPPQFRKYRPPSRRPGLPALATAAVAVVGVGILVFTTFPGNDTSTVRSERPFATPTTTGSSPAEPVDQAPPTSAPVVPSTRAPGTTAPPTTRPPERLTAESRLSLEGIGPVRIGMTLTEASAAAGVPIRLLDQPPGPECRYAAPDRASGTGDELGFMVIDGRIARIDVGIMGPDRIRTVSGMGKGNTEADVRATYPGRIRVEPHEYIPNGRYLIYVPSDPGLRHLSMIFETVDGEVRTFRAGLAEQVSWVEGCS